ncbi:MAG: hypothetical protein OXH50_20005, partial [Gemmatimonadetes bacterium]|nr:hypothetical protein [Gemmatimonadota bacterium]
LIEDKGWLTERRDGTFERSQDVPRLFSSGLFDVGIGDREFECMRVFDIEADSSDSEVIVVAYISRGGRTVLFRRYTTATAGQNGTSRPIGGARQ